MKRNPPQRRRPKRNGRKKGHRHSRIRGASPPEDRAATDAAGASPVARRNRAAPPLPPSRSGRSRQPQRKRPLPGRNGRSRVRRRRGPHPVRKDRPEPGNARAADEEDAERRTATPTPVKGPDRYRRRKEERRTDLQSARKEDRTKVEPNREETKRGDGRKKEGENPASRSGKSRSPLPNGRKNRGRAEAKPQRLNRRKGKSRPPEHRAANRPHVHARPARRRRNGRKVTQKSTRPPRSRPKP